MRVIADGMEHGEAREITRRLADDYDKLGDRAAQRLANGVEITKHAEPK
jgi:hypothetical protein